MQSAAILIVGKGQGVWLNNDVVMRLQVDDSPEPIKELRRLVDSWRRAPREGAAAAGEVGPQERLTDRGYRRSRQRGCAYSSRSASQVASSSRSASRQIGRTRRARLRFF